LRSQHTAVPEAATLLQSLPAVEKIPAKETGTSDKLDPVSNYKSYQLGQWEFSFLISQGFKPSLAPKGSPIGHMNSTSFIFGHELDSDCQPVQLVRGGCDLDAISLPAWHRSSRSAT